MPSMLELREERGKLEHRMREMLDRAESENRDLSAEEDGQFKALHEKDAELRSRIDRQDALDKIARENEELRTASGHRREDFPAGSAVGRDPEERRAADRNGERRTDADLALEGWALRSLGGRVGTHHHEAAKRLGADLYQPHFDISLMGNREFRSLRGMEHRALNTTGEADIIPTDFVAQLERAMLATGSLLQVCDQVRTASGNPMTLPTVDDTDNDAADVDEAESMTDASAEADPTFAKVTFGAFKASSKVVYSTELEQDAGFDLNGELSSLLGERIGRTLNARCTTGNGTTAAQGIVTGSVEGFESQEETAIDPDDILELIHSVDPAYRNQPGVGFMMHDKVLLAIRKLKETETGRYLWQPSMQIGMPSTVHGYPVYINQAMADTLAADAKVMLFGLFRKFRVRLVRGVRLVVARELMAETDEIAMYAHLRYDGRVTQSAAIKHLKLASAS